MARKIFIHALKDVSSVLSKKDERIRLSPANALFRFYIGAKDAAILTAYRSAEESEAPETSHYNRHR